MPKKEICYKRKDDIIKEDLPNMETLMAYVIISCDFLKDINVRMNEMKIEKGNHVTWSHNFNNFRMTSILNGLMTHPSYAH